MFYALITCFLDHTPSKWDPGTELTFTVSQMPTTVAKFVLWKTSTWNHCACHLYIKMFVVVMQWQCCVVDSHFIFWTCENQFCANCTLVLDFTDTLLWVGSWLWTLKWLIQLNQRTHLDGNKIGHWNMFFPCMDLAWRWEAFSSCMKEKSFTFYSSENAFFVKLALYNL